MGASGARVGVGADLFFHEVRCGAISPVVEPFAVFFFKLMKLQTRESTDSAS